MSVETKRGRDRTINLKQNLGHPVEEIFSAPGSFTFVIGTYDGFQALSIFDKPAALIAREMPGGRAFIITRRSNISNLELIERVANDAVRKRGHRRIADTEQRPDVFVDIINETGRRVTEELASRQPE
jgi:hypothetical protein